jgi:alginate O-acetyltransferase complex protein AlgI
VNFASQLFLFLFLPVVLAAFTLASGRGRRLVIAAASLAFCAWAGPAFVLPLLVVTVVDYTCGRVIAGGGARARRIALGVSLTTNLGLLAAFKYASFAVANLNAMLRAAGLPDLAPPDALRLALPLGLSFYTFQSLAYTIDLYYGRTAPARSLVEYATFLSFFPRLTAGPIVRFKTIAEQLGAPAFSLAAFSRGALFFSLGLAKKVALANPCGTVADLAFAAGSLSPIDAWIGLLAFAFQIYFDFSGYTDMAIGLGLLFGIELPANFDRPYRARSITEFWRRWHITLSNWLRDFLFLPIAYSVARRLERFNLPPRREEYASYVAAAIGTMAIAGLWHGAAWTFVLWGLIHGVMMAVERAVAKKRFYRATPDAVKSAVTFLVVLLAWVFFRSATLGDAGRYLAALAGLSETAPGAALLAGVLRQPQQLVPLALAAIVTWAGIPTATFAERPTLLRAATALALLALGVALLIVQSYRPFLYSVF